MACAKTRCEGWYHPGCIGMSEDDLQRLDKYICDKCAKGEMVEVGM